MTGFVKIKSGTYRNTKVVNEVFPLVKHYAVGAKGGFITVDGSGQFGKDKVRVLVGDVTDFEFVHADEYTGIVKTPKSTTSDEERIEQIAERFEILDDMTKATLNGDIRSLIVSGPPGVGKSYTVERELERSALFDQISGRRIKSTIVKGSASPIGLYKTLYDYSDSNCVVVFDDADAIFFDDVSLNILKAALDTGKNRKISWLSESRVLKNEGIPNSFTFNGSVIFITNLQFSNVRSGKLHDHLMALESRSHFVDLTIDTTRDKLLRIKQIIKEGMLDEYDFEQITKDEIINFIETNQAKLRELSLRTVIKVAQLRKAFPLKWEAMSVSSILK